MLEKIISSEVSHHILQKTASKKNKQLIRFQS